MHKPSQPALSTKPVLNSDRAAERRLMKAASFILFALAVLGVGYLTYDLGREFGDLAAAKSQTSTQRLDVLSQTRRNIEGLLVFIDSQAKQIEEAEKTLAALRSEHEGLKPIVEADRKVIDALLAAQDVRTQVLQTRERWIGFFLGVFSSLIASLVWVVGAYIIKRISRAREQIQR